MRVQVASAELRGPAGALFRNGGTSTSRPDDGARSGDPLRDHAAQLQPGTIDDDADLTTALDPSATRRGIALIVALMSMLLLTALGLGLVMTTMTETMITANYRDSGEAMYAADAGVERVMQDLLTVPDWNRILDRRRAVVVHRWRAERARARCPTAARSTSRRRPTC